jgi:hypothetical protein
LHLPEAVRCIRSPRHWCRFLKRHEDTTPPHKAQFFHKSWSKALHCSFRVSSNPKLFSAYLSSSGQPDDPPTVSRRLRLWSTYVASSEKRCGIVVVILWVCTRYPTRTDHSFLSFPASRRAKSTGRPAYLPVCVARRSTLVLIVGIEELHYRGGFGSVCNARTSSVDGHAWCFGYQSRYNPKAS